MRLLRLQDDGSFSLVEFIGNSQPPYAILSHTWGPDNEEVIFQDIVNGTGQGKAGYQKIRFCGNQAKKDGLHYFWVDTCNIDKTSSQELSEAINSMFRWYQNSARCYVYLSDVSTGVSNNDDGLSRGWKSAFKKSRWFTRGWTLQELIAPESVEFFSVEEERLGDKRSLEYTLHDITGIAIECLRGSSLSLFSEKERMSWAAKRRTKREEDEAYCLLGIFDISMPLIYGETREKAFTRLNEQIEKASTNGLLSLNEDKKRMLLESLRFERIDARQTDIKNAHTETCQWLLKNYQYLAWLDLDKLSEHRGFLWIKGKPGSGKSTLMKFAISNIRKSMSNKIVISFFFHARGSNLEKSTTGAYQSLLLQLLERLPKLQRVFESSGFLTPTFVDYQWKIESLKWLLEEVIMGLQQSSVICFIDALDECDEEEIRDMIKFFEHVGKLTFSARIRFQVCFSSRHYPHITIEKGLSLVLEGQEGHNQDITNYLESELRIGKSKVAQQIRSNIQEKASGVFMWVVLVVSILNKEHDRGRIHALQRRLQEIPSDLHELFRDILTRDSRSKAELLLCIQWVLFTKHPLNPEQLYFAILSGVEPENLSPWKCDEITKEDIERFILDCSKGLAEVTASGLQKVQFIHESVKDYLLKENGLSTIWPELKNNIGGHSHERLKQCCFNQIKVVDLSTLESLETLPEAAPEVTTSLPRSITTIFPLLEYAVKHVLHHADEAEGSGIAQEHFIRSFPLSRWARLDKIFEKNQAIGDKQDKTLLYLLAEHNLANLIRIHDPVPACLEEENARHGTPLFAAFAKGSKAAIRVFLQALYSDSQVVPSREWYAQNNQDMLVRQCVPRSFIFSKLRGVLSYSAEFGIDPVLAFLIARDESDLDVKDIDYGCTPLSWAAKNGHYTAAKLLLDTGRVDAEAKDTYGQTPLSWAARNGHYSVVKLLIDTGRVNADMENKYGQTPLLWAAENGHSSIAKILLSISKVDSNAKDQTGRTPLCGAARNGHEAVVKMLLDTENVDVDTKDQEGRTPLSCAVETGRMAVVRLLLDTRKVNANSNDNYGRTPLSWAARNGYINCVELLLGQNNVEADAKDQTGRTPLWWGARNGHGHVVKLLLDTGKTNADVTDLAHGLTPLQWAARNGWATIVQYLLNTGKVDTEAKDRTGRTPLWWATRKGHKEVVKILLDMPKVNTNSTHTT